MKRRQATTGYSFAHYIALTFILPLLACLVVQSLLVVSVCRLGSTEREVLRNTAVFGNSSGPYANIWVGKADGTTDVSWHHIHVVRITPPHSFKHVPRQTTYVVRLLDCLG